MKYLYLIFILILFSPINFLYGQPREKAYFRELEKEEKENHQLVYWNYGYPAFHDKKFARDKVAAGYGFTFKQVAGCLMTEERQRLISKHNKFVNKILSKRIGLNWMRKVYDEMDSVYKIDTTLIQALYNYKPLEGKVWSLLKPDSIYHEFRVYNTCSSGIFVIKALHLRWYGDDEGISVYEIEATYPLITFREVKLETDFITFLSGRSQ